MDLHFLVSEMKRITAISSKDAKPGCPALSAPLPSLPFPSGEMWRRHRESKCPQRLPWEPQLHVQHPWGGLTAVTLPFGAKQLSCPRPLGSQLGWGHRMPNGAAVGLWGFGGQSWAVFCALHGQAQKGCWGQNSQPGVSLEKPLSESVLRRAGSELSPELGGRREAENQRPRGKGCSGHKNGS